MGDASKTLWEDDHQLLDLGCHIFKQITDGLTEDHSSLLLYTPKGEQETEKERSQGSQEKREGSRGDSIYCKYGFIWKRGSRQRKYDM